MRFVNIVIAAGLFINMPAIAEDEKPDHIIVDHEDNDHIKAAVKAEGRKESDVALDISRKPAEVLSYMGLKHGDKAIDIFAGGGYYSELMARVVGSNGEVTAHNLPQFSSTERAKPAWDAMLERNKNMSLLLQQLGDFNPVIKDYDFAMLHLIYHDTYWESERFGIARIDPSRFVAELFASMKSGGVVAVIDHVGGEGETRDIVNKYHRINPDVVKADFLTAGFTLEGESNILENLEDKHNNNVFDASIRGKTDRFVMKFRKP